MRSTTLRLLPTPRDLAQQQAQARESLGENWCLHPNYRPTPRHSNDPARYAPLLDARAAQIRQAAAEARARNPAALPGTH